MIKPTHYNHGQLKRIPLPTALTLLNSKDITKGPQFNTGVFSDIYRGRWVDRHKRSELVIKVPRKGRDDEPEILKNMRRRLWEEAETWVKQQPHPNILPFIGLYVDKSLDFPALVSPLRLDGNIETFLGISNANRRLLCLGIARGLAHLHDHKIIHGDLNPTKVLINKGEDGVPIPEIEFGEARIQSPNRFLEGLYMAPRYTAPEVFPSLQSTPENPVLLPSPRSVLTQYSDVFSLGMVILRVVSGVRPYSNCNESQIALVFLRKGSKEPNFKLHQRHCSMDWIWLLLRRCWGFGGPPHERCKASECLQILGDLSDPTETVQSHNTDDLGVAQLFSKHKEKSDFATKSTPHKSPNLPRGRNETSPEPLTGPSEVLGDHIPFTLGSRHMAGYIATMSAERQEGFEVETAQTHARLELHRSRRSKLAEVGPGGITPVLFTYQDFSNHIFEREGFLFHENCSIGYFIEDGGTKAKVFIEVLRVDQKDEVKRYLIQKAPNWQQLKHINILEFLGLSFDSWQSGDPAIIYPYCFNGTLSHYGRHAELDMRLFMIKGVSEGLGYLHEMRVIHGDLQPSRIFVHDDGHPVISGFGYTEVLAMVEDNSLHIPQEERCFQAIELVIEDGVHPNKASDVCAFALTAYEIWTGMQPFEDGVRELESLSSRDGKETTPRYPSPEPPGTGPLWRLFEDCWGLDPDERLTIKEVIARLMDIRDPSGKGKSKQVDD